MSASTLPEKIKLQEDSQSIIKSKTTNLSTIISDDNVFN